MLKNILKLANNGQFDQARKICEKALANDNKNNEIRLVLGDIYVKLNLDNKAEQCYRTVIAARGESSSLHNRLGLCFQRQKKYIEAENQYKKAINSNFQSDSYFYLAMLYSDQERISEAIDCYIKCCKISPDKFQAYVNLGFTYCKEDNLDSALESFKKAIHIYRGSVRAHIGMGTVYARKRQFSKAINCYRTANEINPDIIEIHSGLAVTFQSMGKSNEAITEYEAVLRIDKNNEQAIHMLAAYSKINAPKMAAPNYVSSLFDQYADAFDEHLVKRLGYKVPEKLAKLSEEFINDTDKEVSILDLGCGTGLSGISFSKFSDRIIGVDISGKMLVQAKKLNIYTNLIQSEIIEYLEKNNDNYDIVIATDVFVYLGELKKIFKLLHKTIRPGGLFGFSIELNDEQDDYILRESGRYAHSPGYIDRLADKHGFMYYKKTNTVIRNENNRPIPGYLIILARKP